MQSRRITFDQAAVQADCFLDAMSRIMDIPGDWHTGLAMLKSNYTLFYSGFLETIQRFLGWTRITKDVRGC